MVAIRDFFSLILLTAMASVRHMRGNFETVGLPGKFLDQKKKEKEATYILIHWENHLFSNVGIRASSFG